MVERPSRPAVIEDALQVFVDQMRVEVFRSHDARFPDKGSQRPIEFSAMAGAGLAALQSCAEIVEELLEVGAAPVGSFNVAGFEVVLLDENRLALDLYSERLCRCRRSRQQADATGIHGRRRKQRSTDLSQPAFPQLPQGRVVR